ncbi:sulfatase-like hydrolase/transferase [Rhodopirellula sp. P2]|uniref:sulfatase-like hydrolase/transferase n=1 Tax=Rhodopirellula sp. P2 TaxID=2127060 RepID=UPI002367C536|nr:sulfatase-like hydrolase/transferase [Rhodopirellula sp. P2]WDQ17378.1 sulfatase-like hydrolase/transferase [Rhodopirellula sp. P2]
MSPQPTPPDNARLLWQQLLWATFIACAVLATTSGHRFVVLSETDASMSGLSISAWRVFQAFAPVAVLLHLGRWKLSWHRWIMAAMTLWWGWVLADLFVFHWIGIRLISADAWTLLSTRVPSLVPYITLGMLLRLTFVIAGWFAIGWTCQWSMHSLARTFTTPSWQLSIRGATYAWTLGILLTAIPGLATWSSTQSSMTSRPSRHALGVTGWFDDRGVDAPTKEQNVIADPLFTAEDVTRRTRNFRFNVVQETQSLSPDVLLIVVESLRPELVHPSVMPNIHSRATQGLWMHRHHSGGNASSLGLFSLLNGLDAIWFYLADVRFSPAMNRLFEQTGYELGFFGGAEDWNAFQMDAFIHSDAYDTFKVEPRDGLASERRAIESAQIFLSDSELPEGERRPPRLAVLYLYTTHAPFLVAPQHVRDLPSADADYPLPFGPHSRTAVWNRYRNSARTLDAMIAPLLQGPNRLVAIVGDHGESFLDDETIGHGTRLSAAQVRTPAIVFGPDVVQREIRFNTSHADLLPTLISLAGIRVSAPNSFDGVDLSADSPRSRAICIADYLRPQALLIDSSMVDSEIFGVQCELTLRPPEVHVLAPKDAQGNSLASPAGFQSTRVVREYFRQAFGGFRP